jgi:hypothetical protein
MNILTNADEVLAKIRPVRPAVTAYATTQVRVHDNVVSYAYAGNAFSDFGDFARARVSEYYGQFSWVPSFQDCKIGSVHPASMHPNYDAVWAGDLWGV